MAKFVRYKLDLYERNGHNHLVTIPFFAVQMTDAEYLAFYSKYNGYSDKVLIRANGDVTTPMAELRADGLYQAPATYPKITQAYNSSAMDALNVAVTNAKLVLPNSRDISQIWWNLAPIGTSKSLAYSLDGGTHIKDDGYITSQASGSNFYIDIQGDIAAWIGYASFANRSEPDVVFKVPIVISDSTRTPYCLTIHGGPGYAMSGNMAKYRLEYGSASEYLHNYLEFAEEADPVPEQESDPYEDFPPSEQGGGEPHPDQEDDDIEDAPLPTLGFTSAGFCRIYCPTVGELNALANYLWTDQTFLQTVVNHLKQIIENPIDAIISLCLIPCTPTVGTSEEVKVMYVPTGVYMSPVANQFIEVDCGTYTLNEMYGSALDYNPYTSVQLYLPYIGIVQLDTDEVMGKTIGIKYRIDVVTGVCCARVKAGKDVLYQFSGHCSIQQPLTSADFSGYINAALAAGKLVASIAAAGAGAPAVAATLAGAATPSISGTSSETRTTERNEKTGRQITSGTRVHESVTESPGASFGEIATRGVSNTVGAVMNSKTIVQHSGGFSGNSGYIASVRRPFLIVTHPNIANPKNYGKYNGRPSMKYLNLGDCSGYTQVQSIQLTGIDATNPELSEISTLLMSGVIL